MCIWKIGSQLLLLDDSSVARACTVQELALLDREAYLICRNAHLTEDLQSSQAVHRHASKRDAVPTRHDADPLGESFSLRPQECTYVCMYIMCVCVLCMTVLCYWAATRGSRVGLSGLSGAVLTEICCPRAFFPWNFSDDLPYTLHAVP